MARYPVSVSCIIPFRSSDPHREELLDMTYGRIMSYFPEWEVIIGDNEGQEFSRSAARNAGASFASGEMLVFCDADTIWNPEQLEMALQVVHDSDSWCLPYTMYYNLNELATEAILQCDEYDLLVEPEEEEYDHALDYVISGTLVLPRFAYDAVGGYDERFIGWGYEDDAFSIALTNLVGHVQRVEGFVCHLWHPVASDEGFGQPHIEHNRRLWQAYKQAAERGTMSAFLGVSP